MTEEIIRQHQQIENLIFNIRGKQVMLDYHLAGLYQVETKRLNEQVKRNKRRFPEQFMFQLNKEEWTQLQSQIATTEEQHDLRSQIATTKRRTLPFVFTEQGVAMLSAVLNSDAAIKTSIVIMQAFVSLRKFLLENASVFQRLERVEYKQLESDKKIEQIFQALGKRDVVPNYGVFFDGQVFDAYELVSKIIRSAKQSIILIDNYVNENTLTHLTKKADGVKVLLLTKSIGSQLALDLQKANEQYPVIIAKTFTRSHDRFLIVDMTEIYHLGASLKDLGKKWFAFSKMDKNSVAGIFNSISELI